ncbi:MAG: type II secretion system protein [Thermotogota bacterium]|nr:type II secretion system protein [Thermotogota bacterium]
MRKQRKEGFSLIELLIVLTVIAALISTITPIAMNAVRKAEALQVAMNLKVLALSVERRLILNKSVPDNIKELGRDIDTENYGIAYSKEEGTYKVAVFTTDEVHFDTLHENLISATNTTDVIPDEAAYIPGGLQEDSIHKATALYYFELQLY